MQQGAMKGQLLIEHESSQCQNKPHATEYETIWTLTLLHHTETELREGKGGGHFIGYMKLPLITSSYHVTLCVV